MGKPTKKRPQRRGEQGGRQTACTAYVSSAAPGGAAGERLMRCSSGVGSTDHERQTKTPHTMDNSVLFSALLAVGLYLNTLPAEFAYDDSRAILKNPDLTGSTPLLHLFTNDFWGTPLTHSGSHKSYRPLCVLSFRLNHAIGGLNPFGYHLGNVLLHAVATGLFTHTVLLLTSGSGAGSGGGWYGSAGCGTFVAQIAGLLFASHPIHTEAVAGVVGRADILSCIFFLLALQAYMRYCCHRDAAQPSHNDCANFTKTKLELLLVGIMTLCAMLSKEQGVTVLAICALYDVFIHSRLRPLQLLQIHQTQHRPVLEGLLSLLFIGSLLIGGRVYLMGNKPPEFAPADNPASDSDSLLTRTLTFYYLPFLNAWLLLYPRVLSFDWSMEAVPLVESLWDPRNICSLTFYFLLIYAIVYIMRYVNCGEGGRGVFSLGNSNTSYINGGVCANGSSNGNGHTHCRTSHASHTPHTQDNGHVISSNYSAAVSQNLPSSRTNGNTSHSHSNIHHRKRVRRNSTSSTDSNTSDDSSSSTVTTTTGIQLTSIHILLLSLSLLIFPFIPATNLFFYVGFVIAERVLYIPSMGFCLLVGYGAYAMRSRYCGATHEPVRSPRNSGDSETRSRYGTAGTETVQRKVLYMMLGALVLGYGFRTVLRNMDWKTEENLYRAGINVNPAKAWGNLANILNSKGDPAAAEEAYRAALMQRGNMADVHYNLGILLQEQKRYAEAVDSYKMAIQCRPRLTMAYLNLGIVYTNLGRKDEAEKVYRHCAEIDISGLKDPRLHEQTKISALYNLGRLLADQERYHESADIYKLAIQRRPQHYAPQSLYNMLGEAYFKLDQLEEAEMWYQRALKAKPDHIPAHLTMGKLMHKRGDPVGAEDWFIKARMIDPKDGSVYQHYGQFLGEINRFKESADNYVRAAILSPEDFELVFNAANALRQAGQHVEAEDFYRKAARISPKTATAHMNLGAMLHFNGKLAEAESSYLMALALKPDDAVTQANLKKLRNLRAKATGGGGNR